VWSFTSFIHLGEIRLPLFTMISRRKRDGSSSTLKFSKRRKTKWDMKSRRRMLSKFSFTSLSDSSTRIVPIPSFMVFNKVYMWDADVKYKCVRTCRQWDLTKSTLFSALRPVLSQSRLSSFSSSNGLWPGSHQRRSRWTFLSSGWIILRPTSIFCS